MFDAEYKIIAETTRKANELEQKLIRLCAPLGIKHAFDFPGSKVKTSAELAQAMTDQALKSVLDMHQEVIELHKAYQAAQKKITAGWEGIEKQRKQEAKQILDGLETAKQQVFDNKKFHPGCFSGFLTDGKIKLANDAIKLPGAGGSKG